MVRVSFPTHLLRHYPVESTLEIEGSTVRELFDQLNQAHPRLVDYLLDERGVLRKHVNVFIDDEPLQDRETLRDPVLPHQRIQIIQALSGG